MCMLHRGFERTVQKATDILRKYFSGNRVLFDLPLDMSYYTRFQKAVWRATAGIPYGETRSYAWVAKKIGNPRAVRAVGQALGVNPVPIIIPCHRVIGSSGKLCGFADGLELKQKLLELENRKKGNGDREKRGNK
jgi:methylated-DNA-[protein]-cysteine S-methyltransferase